MSADRLQGAGADGPFVVKETEWLSVRIRPGEGGEVRFLRWYAAADDGLLLLVGGDDPLLVQTGSGTPVEVAPVRARGSSPASRHYVSAVLEVLGAEDVDRAGSLLNAKYGSRRRIYRAGRWVVQRLDGSHRRPDVVVRIQPPAET